MVLLIWPFMSICPEKCLGGRPQIKAGGVAALVLMMLLTASESARPEITTAPPQPVNTPPPPPAWWVVRTQPALPAAARGSAAPVGAPATAQKPGSAPAASVPAPNGAGGRPPRVAAPEPISLPEFLKRTLGRTSDRPYLLMPGLADKPIGLIGDLAGAELADPQELVRLVLQNLGLEMVESSGVTIIQLRRELDPAEDQQETWVYSPRNRPIHSLAPYFPNFPRLRFIYAPVASPRSHGSDPTSGSGLMQPASSMANPSSGWPANESWGPSPSAGGAAFPGLGTLTPSTTASYNTSTFTGSAAGIGDPSFLIVRGLPRDIAQLQAFMERVDIPLPEVQLRMYVLEVRDQHSQSGAVQLLMNLLSERLTIDIGVVPSELNRIFLGGRDMSLAISRLTGDSRVRLVSSPTLRVADGSTASVTIGTDTPTLGSIITFSGAVQQSVAYQSAGVLLNVSPNILNESIRLMIWQEISSFAKTETGLSSTPTKLRRAFRTDVVARSGEVLMLGGLNESSQTESRQRGWLGLGSRSSERLSSEIVVLLQVLRI